MTKKITMQRIKAGLAKKVAKVKAKKLAYQNSQLDYDQEVKKATKFADDLRDTAESIDKLVEESKEKAGAI